jgi:hypothetical protein
VAFRLATIDNETGRALVIDRIRPHHARGEGLLGIMVAREGYLGTTIGWPQRGSRAPAGFRVAPHSTGVVVLGAVSRRDSFAADGVDVRYHRRYGALDINFEDHVGMSVAICPPSESAEACVAR